MKRTARDVLLGSQPSATHHQPPAAAQQQPPSQPQPPAAQQQPPAQPQVQQPLLHQPQPPQQQPAVSHQQPPALVATPSQPQQQRPAGPAAAPQAGHGTTSPRRGKGTSPLLVGGFAAQTAHQRITASPASPTPPPEMPSQRMKEEGTYYCSDSLTCPKTHPSLARRACGAQRISAALPAAPGTPHAAIDDAAQRGLAPAPIAHAAVATADGPPTVHAGSLLLLCLFPLSFLFCEPLVSVRAHRLAGQQTLQEAAEDSKNLDTFDNSTPISSGSLADLSAASASLEMAAAAAARTSSPLLLLLCRVMVAGGAG